MSPSRIAFIACSKTKAMTPGKARWFYRGALFHLAMKYCLPRFDQVFILSARYGLVGLDDTLAPYEETLKGKTREHRQAWTKRILDQMKAQGVEGEFWFFTGRAYCEFLNGHKPLSGLSMGRQLAWFKREIARETKRTDGFIWRT